MVARSDLLAAELKTLRKGRGVSVAQIGDRVGPALRTLCGVPDGANVAEVRQKLGDRLEKLAGELPDDLRVAALVALGLHREAQRPFYQERVRWLAEYLQRDERTARRRADEALERLAEISVAPGVRQNAEAQGGGDEWYVTELRCIMVLDRPEPEAFEYRRITANRDQLGELDLSLTVPRDQGDSNAPHDLQVEVVYGGTLVRRQRESANRFGFVLELPEPLRRYESTEFVLRFGLPTGQRMRPHYVLAPLRRCDIFDLRVRFDRAHPPRQVWQVREAFHRDLDDGTARGELVTPDQAGEIHLRFRNLRPALSYGAQWQHD
jgi:hypothetical protein